MFKFLKNNSGIIFLLVCSLLAHFLFLSYPNQIVFDEVYFGQFVNSYFNHQYYFDIHPPLGKLIIASFVWIFHGQSSFDFSKIGNPAVNIFLMRFMPALAGTLLVLVIYFLVLKMGLSKKSAFIAGFLVLFDNAILTQSKFVLVDIFLLFFGFLSLYFVFCYKNVLYEGKTKKAILFLILSGVSAVLAFSIKWTGLSFIAICFIYFLAVSFKKVKIKYIVLWLAMVLALGFLVYFSIFYIHLKLLYLPGGGDAYMSQQFQQNKLSTWQKFIELNQKMYFYNSTLKATHPYSSEWYQWPVDKRAIWYWTNAVGGKTASIWLLGNPIIWFAVLIAVAAAVIGIFFKWFRKKIPPVFYFLILGYFLNLLPFILISRIAFLYHYLSALIFGILILTVLYESFVKQNSTAEFIINYIFLPAVLIAFLVFAPLTYGLPLSEKMSAQYGSVINFFL